MTSTTSTPATTNTTTPTAAANVLIIVASLNPVKIRATQSAFSLVFATQTHIVRGVHAPSGVSEQPFSDAETLRGALNRVSAIQRAQADADFWVGIEGGIAEDDDFHLQQVDDNDGHDGSSIGLLQSFAWVVVRSRQGGTTTGKARTAMYYLPRETAELVHGGMELGHAEDVVWGQANSKQKNGSVGLLTGDVVDRAAYYTQAAVLALIPFKNPKLTF